MTFKSLEARSCLCLFFAEGVIRLKSVSFVLLWRKKRCLLLTQRTIIFGGLWDMRWVAFKFLFDPPWPLLDQVKWEEDAETEETEEVEQPETKVDKNAEIAIIEDYEPENVSVPVISASAPEESQSRKLLPRFGKENRMKCVFFKFDCEHFSIDRVKGPSKNPPSNVRVLVKRESVSLENSRSQSKEEEEGTPGSSPSISSSEPTPPRVQPMSRGAGRGFGIAFDPSQVKLRNTKAP
jgi:hypothetical protein